MKATGIVRRVDELGRIVIPMELRRTFDIRDNDPVEVFTEEDKIILKKYDTKSDYKERLGRLKQEIRKDCGPSGREEILRKLEELGALLDG